MGLFLAQAIVRLFRAPSTGMPTLNTRYMGWVNSILCGYLRLRQCAIADVGYLFIRKSSVPMLKPKIMTPLNFGITVVVANRAKFKMLGIDAWRIIAGVQDTFAFRNRPNEHTVDVAMRLRPVPTCATHSGYASISPCGVVASPQPAGWRFLNSILYGYRRKNPFVPVEPSKSSFTCIAQLAQVAAKCPRLAKKAFLFTLFHGCAHSNGPVVTIP